LFRLVLPESRDIRQALVAFVVCIPCLLFDLASSIIESKRVDQTSWWTSYLLAIFLPLFNAPNVAMVPPGVMYATGATIAVLVISWFSNQMVATTVCPLITALSVLVTLRARLTPGKILQVFKEWLQIGGMANVMTEEVQGELAANAMLPTLAGQIETVPQQQGTGNDMEAVLSGSVRTTVNDAIIELEAKAKKIRQETQGDFIRPFDTNIFF
jgi:hypothetical protein